MLLSSSTSPLLTPVTLQIRAFVHTICLTYMIFIQYYLESSGIQSFFATIFCEYDLLSIRSLYRTIFIPYDLYLTIIFPRCFSMRPSAMRSFVRYPLKVMSTRDYHLFCGQRPETIPLSEPKTANIHSRLSFPLRSRVLSSLS